MPIEKRYDDDDDGGNKKHCFERVCVGVYVIRGIIIVINNKANLGFQTVDSVGSNLRSKF